MVLCIIKRYSRLLKPLYKTSILFVSRSKKSNRVHGANNNSASLHRLVFDCFPITTWQHEDFIPSPNRLNRILNEEAHAIPRLHWFSPVLDCLTLLLYTISLDALHFLSINPRVLTCQSDETAQRRRIWIKCQLRLSGRSRLCLNALSRTHRKSERVSTLGKECVLMVLGGPEGWMCRGHLKEHLRDKDSRDRAFM